jgi:hypothetical protein
MLLPQYVKPHHVLIASKIMMKLILIVVVAVVPHVLMRLNVMMVHHQHVVEGMTS